MIIRRSRATTFTGYDVDGGYAESVRARADFCIALPAGIDGPAAAPLLCAGVIGFRSYRKCGAGLLLGLSASERRLISSAKLPFRTLGTSSRSHGREMGTRRISREALVHDGLVAPDKTPPDQLAAIVFAASGELVTLALKLLRKGVV